MRKFEVAVVGLLATIVVLLAILIWELGRGEQDPQSNGNRETLSSNAAVGADGQSADVMHRAIADEEGAHGLNRARLAEIDRLTIAGELTEAQRVLESMLEDQPDDAILLWRQGRIFAKHRKSRRKNGSKALAAYGAAVDADRLLLADHEFYSEIRLLLNEPRLRSVALEFVLRKMGPSGHTFLLAMVNDETRPMGYDDRRRAREELLRVDDNQRRIDWRLSRGLDLLQAAGSQTPCSAYRAALEGIARSPDYWYLRRVIAAALPKPMTGETLTEEQQADAMVCDGLEQQRAEVIAKLEALSPDEPWGGELIEDDDGPAEGDDGPHKSVEGKESEGKHPGCDKPFSMLNKRCRGGKTP